MGNYVTIFIKSTATLKRFHWKLRRNLYETNLDFCEFISRATPVFLGNYH